MTGSVLGRPEVQMAADVDQRLGNGDSAAQRVDSLGPQPEELAGRSHPKTRRDMPSSPSTHGERHPVSTWRKHSIVRRSP
jgi:hypothetical protein